MNGVGRVAVCAERMHMQITGSLAGGAKGVLRHAG
jgi:hypothetical protein